MTLHCALSRAAILLVLGAAGCSSDGLDFGFSVALTARFGADVDAARLASVASITLAATGDETYSHTFSLGRAAAREERLVYRPAAGSRNVELVLDAFDGAAQRVASGSGTLVLVPGTTQRYELVLQATSPVLDYPSVVKADEPLAYYRLGELSGQTAKDASGHFIDAQYLGAVALGQTGAVSGGDTAVYFDGALSGVTAINAGFDFTGNAPFSLEAWLSPTKMDDVFRNLFELEEYDGSSRRQQYSLYLYGQHGIDFTRVVDDEIRYVSAPAPPLGVFTHLVAVYDGATMTIYENGSRINSIPDARPSPSKNAELKIGHGNSTEVAVMGTMDEVAVYTTALSAARIQAHYIAGRAP